MTPREIALSICEPWFNGDPCEGCKCHKVCTKLVERIETAIQAVDSTVADHIVGANKKADHIPDVGKMVASVRENRTVEPVAWLSQGGDVSRSRKYFEEMGFTDLIPLYTAPAKREPLTDEEIIECVAEVDDARLAGPITALIRAIERAHGIGGEE